MQFPRPSDLPSDGHRCLKRILTGADSGPASSLFRASLSCCPAFTSEPAHRIYTTASDSPSRLLPLSSSLFATPSRSPSPSQSRWRSRAPPPPACACPAAYPAQRIRLSMAHPATGGGCLAAVDPALAASQTLTPSLSCPCRSSVRLRLRRTPFAGYTPPRARTGRSPCQSRPRRLRSLKGACPLRPWGLKAAPSSATSERLHGCGAASSPEGSRARPCSSLLILFPVPGSFHAHAISFYL